MVLLRTVVTLAILLVSSRVEAQGSSDTRIGPAEWDVIPEAKGSGTTLRQRRQARKDQDAIVEFLLSEEGGVPDGPTPNEVVIDALEAVFARADADEKAGLPSSYAIKFADDSDWVQLASGEWIKGDVKRMRDAHLEFDSEDLGLEEIDFSDVVRLHSPSRNTYIFDGRITATGLAIITEDELIIQTRRGTRTFPRSELEGIVEGGEREKDWWWMELGFGLTLNRGNTDQLTYDLLFTTRREDSLTRLDLNYNASFGQTGSVQNVNRHLAELELNVFLSSRWYVVPIFGQLFNDRFQNVRFRASPATGAGLRVLDNSTIRWNFQTGLGYQHLNYLDGSQSIRGNPQNDLFIPFFTDADLDLVRNVNLRLSWLTNLVVTNVGNTNHTAHANLRIRITNVLTLNVAFLYLRTEQPAPPLDPGAPPIKKNDYQLIVGISVELG